MSFKFEFGILQARTLEWVAISFPMHESEKWKWSRSVVSDSSQPHGLQPTRLRHPWDFQGKSTGVGCHRHLRYKNETIEIQDNGNSKEKPRVYRKRQKGIDEPCHSGQELLCTLPCRCWWLSRSSPRRRWVGPLPGKAGVVVRAASPSSSLEISE